MNLISFLTFRKIIRTTRPEVGLFHFHFRFRTFRVRTISEIIVEFEKSASTHVLFISGIGYTALDQIEKSRLRHFEQTKSRLNRTAQTTRTSETSSRANLAEENYINPQRIPTS